MKPVIIHYRERFLKLTESFIYQYLMNLNNFEVKVVCKRKYDEWDLSKWDVYEVQGKGKVARIMRGLLQYNFPLLSKKVIDKKIFNIIKSVNAKLIHAHFGHNGWEMLKVKEMAGIPLVTTFYGYDISQLPLLEVWAKRYQELFKQGDLFLVEGSFMAGKLLKLGCPENKIRIQRLAIDLSELPFKEKRNKQPGEVVTFLFCGRLIEKKGVIYALKAIKDMHMIFPNIELRIIGDGELRDELMDYVKGNAMTSYITFLGMLPRKDVIKEMSDADIFIHPSVTASDGDSEGGAPTILLEAQACGLPILSTYHCDIPEFVSESKSALLSPERDVEKLKDNILKLINGNINLVEMSRAGREHVQKKYNIHHEVKSLEDTYAGLI